MPTVAGGAGDYPRTDDGRVAGVAADSELDWLPGVRRIDSPNFDARPPAATIDLVVIHAISLPPGEFGGGFIEQLFTNTLAAEAHPYFTTLAAVKVSAHLLIDRAGTPTQFVALGQRAWHAGQSSWRGREACNDFSIGIELEGCDELPFTAAQYAALCDLLAVLRSRFPHIGQNCIVGHSEIAPQRKTDPGPCFDWGRIRPAQRK